MSIVPLKTTLLNLLTREGMVQVIFEARLTLDQYTALHEAVRLADTKDQLIEALERVAAGWAIHAEVERFPEI